MSTITEILFPICAFAQIRDADILASDPNVNVRHRLAGHEVAGFTADNEIFPAYIGKEKRLAFALQWENKTGSNPKEAATSISALRETLCSGCALMITKQCQGFEHGGTVLDNGDVHIAHAPKLVSTGKSFSLL
jgi:hypothetical protein